MRYHFPDAFPRVNDTVDSRLADVTGRVLDNCGKLLAGVRLENGAASIETEVSGTICRQPTTFLGATSGTPDAHPGSTWWYYDIPERTATLFDQVLNQTYAREFSVDNGWLMYDSEHIGVIGTEQMFGECIRSRRSKRSPPGCLASAACQNECAA